MSKDQIGNRQLAIGNQLARRLGLFDATMIVMGGVIGSGIFMNPSVVAGQVHTPFLILFAWAFGGLVALAGAFIYAELAERRPHTGGQYAYLREAYHPSVAFVYGWARVACNTNGRHGCGCRYVRKIFHRTHARKRQRHASLR
jgi:APA family basic amino acid/polyamine antiporter